jgi:hypothetical protein
MIGCGYYIGMYLELKVNSKLLVLFGDLNTV